MESVGWAREVYKLERTKNEDVVPLEEQLIRMYLHAGLGESKGS